ncbi:MAG: NUDIX domain-containing protein [Paracoccus sp. (in: a-proteobacteria)]|nr:NUDIX domain-containing protein [Paracoccus sp. (in: a-proteobacteria)]
MDRTFQGHPRLSLAAAIPQKVCPLVTRRAGDQRQLLAFAHPLAGHQFVKGSIEPGEAPVRAAIRELAEESGIRLMVPPAFLGAFPVGPDGQIWHFFDCQTPALPDRWQHRTEDGGGLLFDFFWHPFSKEPGGDWHPVFHDAYGVIHRLLGGD